MDITEKENALRKLEHAEKKFALAFEQAPAMAAICDFKDCTINEINSRFAKRLGYTKTDIEKGKISGKRIFAKPSTFNSIKNSLSKGNKIKDKIIKLKTKKGKKISVLFSAEVFKISGDKFILMVARGTRLFKKTESKLKKLKK